MTTQDNAPPGSFAPLGDEPPPAVAAAAQSYHFGPRVASRFLANPFVVAGMLFGLSALSLGLLVVVSKFGDDTGGVLRSLLRVVALFFCFAFVGLLTAAIATLARGAQSYHVYAGGFVHRRNGKVRALAWSEIAELRPVVVTKGDNAGKVQQYQLVPRQGAPVGIPLTIENGRDEYMDRLMAVLRQNGVVVR